MTQKKLRVGVIGVGYLGRIHTKIYSQLDDVELIGVYDTDSRSAVEVASLYQCESFESIDDLLDKVDAVSVVVPTVYHYDVAVPIIKRKIAMLLEKPIASTSEQALELVDLAQEHDCILQVGHLERFNASTRAIADMVDQPRFIEAHRLSQFTPRATDVDVVKDLMIHDIDLVLMLIKSPLEHVSASGVSVLTDKVDIANARLEFENGSVANITASRVSDKRVRRLRVFANDQYIAADLDNNKVDVITKIAANNPLGIPSLRKESLELDSVMPLDEEIKHFISSVTHNHKPLITGEDGLAALRVAEQIVACIDKTLKKAGNQ